MVNEQRIISAQERMRAEGIDAYLILTHDDYLYFFGEDRFQPRAIIPSEGPPVIITFRGEEDEVRENLGTDEVKVFGTVGQQIKDVVETMRSLWAKGGNDGKLRVGVQMGFFTPYFLLTMFQKANPQVEVVNIAPVMDPLRMIKDETELRLIQQACQIAEQGMATVKQYLKPGITEHDLATEILYTIRKAGASGTAVPVFVNSGKRSGWLHGTATNKPIEAGELIVINLVPQYQGYCANLCRTFVIGEPTPKQQDMLDTHYLAQQAAVGTMQHGVTMKTVDNAAKAVFEERGYGEHYVPGFSHSIGLMFEETPMPTIHPSHMSVALQAGMTITAGHSVLSVPGIGGARVEDTYYLTQDGAQPLTHFEASLK